MRIVVAAMAAFGICGGLAGCMTPIDPARFATGGPAIDPIAFFSIRLEQDIRFSDGRSEHRTWRLHRIDLHRFQAQVSDSRRPFEAEAHGPVFHFAYRLKMTPGATLEQWLYLQPDGRTLINQGVVRIIGVVVARLSETIVLSPPAT